MMCENQGIKIKSGIGKLGFVSYFLRNRTQSWCPYISAMRAGLSPQQSSLSIGAWRECSRRSTASRPDSAAKWAGVHPCSVLRHGLAPCSIRILTVSVCPVAGGKRHHSVIWHKHLRSWVLIVLQLQGGWKKKTEPVTHIKVTIQRSECKQRV